MSSRKYMIEMPKDETHLTERGPEMLKVQLKCDFRDKYGLSFQKGQTGEVSHRHWFGECQGVLVCFDGYEKDKEAQRKLIQENGEGANIVPWGSIVPKEILDLLDVKPS